MLCTIVSLLNTGTPGQLSPGSTTSVAPTIPTAPQSPCDNLDSFDFNQPYDFGLNAPPVYNTLPYSTKHYNMHSQASKSFPDYEHDYTPSPNPTHFSTLDGRSSNKENRRPDIVKSSYDTYGAENSRTAFRNEDFFKDNTLDRKNKSYSYEKPQMQYVSSDISSGPTYQLPNGDITTYNEVSGANLKDSSSQINQPNHQKYPM